MEVVNHKKKISLNNLSFIGALPGVGSVGKISIEYLIEKLKAKRFQTLQFPNSINNVIISENNTLEFPKVEIYHKKINGHNLLFLTGDLSLENTLEIRETISHTMSLLTKNKCQKAISLAGIALETAPEKPDVYAATANKKFHKNFNFPKTVKKNVNNVIRSINGFSGLLPMAAHTQNISSVCLLGETFNSPFFLGLKSAREILKVLDKEFTMKLCFKDLDKEIKEFDKLFGDVEAVEEEKGESQPNYFN